jgi:hypothetical protein
MKNLWLPSIFSFLLFGLVMGVMTAFQSGSVETGLVIGLLSGAAFTAIILIFKFAVKRFRVFGMKEVEGWAPGEVILLSGDANIMRHGLAEGDGSHSARSAVPLTRSTWSAASWALRTTVPADVRRWSCWPCRDSMEIRINERIMH